jgi:C4-dicarboxylate transporter, DctM subunit
MLAVGAVLYPALIKEGYSKRFAVGALMAGGSLGIIIPPSVPMIIYGIVTESSISDLFLAGVGPGLLIASVFALYAAISNRHLPRRPFNLAAFLNALREGVAALMLPIILLGGIYSGYFSPTEAGAVALGYAVLVELLWYREMSFQDYFTTTTESAKLIGALFLLLALAMSLMSILTEHRVPEAIVKFTVAHIENPHIFMLAMNGLLLALGLVLETGPAIIITAPILGPVADSYGYSLTHLGIIMILNLEIGMLTPPMGLNLIVATTAFKVSFADACWAAVPWILMMVGCLALVIAFPWIALGLI